MLQDLLQELLVFAIEDRSLRTVVHVQQLEQDAKDDRDDGYQIHGANLT